MNDNLQLNKILSGINKTMTQRNNVIPIGDYEKIIAELESSNKQREMWLIYSRDTPYAKHLKFEEVFEQIKLFVQHLNGYFKNNEMS